MAKKYIEIVQDTRDQLNKVGKGFCLAIWKPYIFIWGIIIAAITQDPIKLIKPY